MSSLRPRNRPGRPRLSLARRLRAALLTIAVATSLASCGGSTLVHEETAAPEGLPSSSGESGPIEPTETTEAARAAAERVEAATGATVEAPDPVLDGDSVVAAALVIAAGGDIEEALLRGEFTLGEVYAAIAAIETDTLDQYLES